ncbi:MAG: hypothetical protein BLM47_10460 [Candidatus Reconcilbacillus cellulovorans]|uniref:SLH domain-containing protein n=1 Tax=Candidatus Reconcilbacillus cellulovorans TaxID=1906605 RepID=A0A2A6DYL6_9BACL|nr:MAG: hypothetical protein BLM47_10460 [Candidatus Reconcilbacillus cellulovorans]
MTTRKTGSGVAVFLTLALAVFLFPLPASAAGAPSFELAVKGGSMTAGRELQVSVIGRNLADLYAYEITLRVDPKALRLKKAESVVDGFSVDPIVQGDQIQFAHTKIGEVPGESGDKTLCTLTFEVLRGGPARVTLEEVKTVNSALEMETYAINRTVVTGGFVDITGHWAEGWIRTAVERGWAEGYEDGTFRPDAKITRAEFVKLLVVALGLEVSSKNEAIGFADEREIPDWARPYVAAAVRERMVEGYEDGTFRSNRTMTRAEMVTVIGRTVGIPGHVKTGTLFADDGEIPDWARGFVAAGAEAGFVSGRGGGRFDPHASATRAEAIKWILYAQNAAKPKK